MNAGQSAAEAEAVKRTFDAVQDPVTRDLALVLYSLACHAEHHADSAPQAIAVYTASVAALLNAGLPYQALHAATEVLERVDAARATAG